jgi:hypothetical protein
VKFAGELCKATQKELQPTKSLKSRRFDKFAPGDESNWGIADIPGAEAGVILNPVELK